MGLKLTGNVMVFKNEKGAYSTSISNKNVDGTYTNSYITLQFKKGVDLENKTRIIINDSFLSFYKTQDNKIIYKIVVLDFAKEGDACETDTSYADNNSLPF